MIHQNVTLSQVAHIGSNSMFIMVQNLLQNCRDVETLAVDDPLALGRAVSRLERLKRFKGSLEMALSFCKGKPVEDMALGPFTRVPKSTDLSYILCCPSVSLLRVQLWGIAWEMGIVKTLASACPQLEALEILTIQEKARPFGTLH